MTTTALLPETPVRPAPPGWKETQARAAAGIHLSEPAADLTPVARRQRWPWLVALALVAAAVAFFQLRPGPATGPAEGDARPVPVRAAEVVTGDLSIETSYPGELVGEVTDISPQVSGQLREVPVRIGDRVRRGQLLAVVNDVNLRNQFHEAQGQQGVADANRRRTEAELEGVEADHRRSMELFRERLLSEQEFDRVNAQLATARASLAASDAQVAQAGARVNLLRDQLADTRLVAPFDGTVAARYLDRGASVGPGTPILRLVEEAPLLVQFRVPERDLSAITPGVRLGVRTQATAGRTFVGEALRVSGEVSRTDRSALVEGRLIDDSDLLLPGMYAEVQVRLSEITDGLIVPGEAILERTSMAGETTTGVFVVNGENARWTMVGVRGRSGNRAAIRGDLEAGDLVLTLGHAELRDGSPVRVVQQQPADGGAPTAAQKANP